MVLCLWTAELPPVSAVSVWTSQAPHGSFPVNIQRFSILPRGLLLQSPAAAQGGLLSPLLTERPCQGYTHSNKALVVHLLGQEEEREPAQVSEAFCDRPAIGGVILEQEEAKGSQFCQTLGVRNGMDPCALCSPHGVVQQSGVAKPHVALSHRGTFPIVPLFFFPPL